MEEPLNPLSTVFHRYANMLESLPTSLYGREDLPAMRVREAGGEELPL